MILKNLRKTIRKLKRFQANYFYNVIIRHLNKSHINGGPPFEAVQLDPPFLVNKQ